MVSVLRVGLAAFRIRCAGRRPLF